MTIEEWLKLRKFSGDIHRHMMQDIGNYFRSLRSKEIAVDEIISYIDHSNRSVTKIKRDLDIYLDSFATVHSGTLMQQLSKQLEDAWRMTEAFYEEHDDRTVLQVLSDLKSKGYHKKLRAGISLFTLILSRAISHGLAGNEAAVMINSSLSNRHLNLGLREGELLLGLFSLFNPKYPIFTAIFFSITFRLYRSSIILRVMNSTSLEVPSKGDSSTISHH